jgi:hypothetical protein
MTKATPFTLDKMQARSLLFAKTSVGTGMCRLT